MNSIASNDTTSGNLPIDRAGTLMIPSLSIDDAGYYTCERNNAKELVVQLDVVGEYIEKIAKTWKDL